MAMDADAMGTAIKDAIDEVDDKTDRTELFRAMASAIINHIQNNAEVATNVSVESVSGVTTGSGVSGTGTGSGSGTIA